MERDPHVPLRWLVDALDGLLRGDRLRRATMHLERGCGQCRRRRRLLERIIAALAAGPLEHAPRAEDRRALRMFAATRAASARSNAGSRPATLVLDVRPQFAGALRAAPGDSRQMLWSLDGFELDVRIVARADGADLFGQVVPAADDDVTDVSGRVVAVSARGEELACAELATDGRFDLRGLRPGALALRGVVDGTPFLVPLIVIS